MFEFYSFQYQQDSEFDEREIQAKNFDNKLYLKSAEKNYSHMLNMIFYFLCGLPFHV